MLHWNLLTLLTWLWWMLIVSAAQVPTMTPAYFKTPKTQFPQASPTATTWLVEPPAPSVAPSPASGMDIHFSSEIYDAILAARTWSCRQVDEHCVRALGDILDGRHARLETRSLPLLIGLSELVAGYIAVMLAAWPSKKPPKDLHIAAPEIEGLSAAFAASTFAIKGPSSIVTISLTSTSDGAPEVIGEPNSDIVITMSESLAARLNDIIHMYGQSYCDAGKNFFNQPTSRRYLGRMRLMAAGGDGLGRAMCGATGALQQTGGPLNDLLVMVNRLGPLVPRAQDVLRALRAAMEFAAGLDVFSDEVRHHLLDVAPVIFAIAYENIVNNIPIGPRMTIAAADFTTTPPIEGIEDHTRTSSSTSTSTSKCPWPTLRPQSPMCNDPKCDGWNFRQKCKANTKYKTCDCWVQVRAEAAISADESYLDAIYTFMSRPDNIQTLSGNQQQIALASYINPIADKKSLDAWNRMIDFPSNKVSVLVANVLNGPNSRVNEDWAKVIERASKSGKLVIGYVRTGYLGVSQQQYTTMLGSRELADWIAQIETEVELWYKLYGDSIKGIFFDEAWNDCGPSDLYARVYRMISENTKRRHPGAFTVLNPGDHMDQCFEDSADTLLTYESNYTNYIDPQKHIYRDNGWRPKDIRKLWHIIHNVPEDKVREATQLAQQRGAGFVHITNAVLPNPYIELPNQNYMRVLMEAVGSGKPAVEPARSPSKKGIAPRPPTSLRATFIDYSSVKLEWSPQDASGFYVIYLNDKEVARLLGTMQAVTIPDLRVGSKGNRFKVAALNIDGATNGFSNELSIDTLLLPGNKPIVNIVVSATATQTIYEADVLLPYSFMRIQLTDPDTKCELPAYETNTDTKFVCSHYMVEKGTAYKYTADKPAENGNWPWKWSPVSALDDDGNNIRVERNHYHYKWYFPVGMSTMDTTKFLVQGEGFSPRVDIFRPCPCSWKHGDGVIESQDTGQKMYCQGKAEACPPPPPTISNIGSLTPAPGAGGGPRYDCKGEGLCKLMKKMYCDKAINQMQRGSKVYIARKDDQYAAQAGNCWGTFGGGGCSVQVRGTDDHGQPCRMTGDEMWHTYQNITNHPVSDCRKCGTYHFGNGCMMSIDYMYGCDNDKNRMVDLGFLNPDWLTLESPGFVNIGRERD